MIITYESKKSYSHVPNPNAAVHMVTLTSQLFIVSNALGSPAIRPHTRMNPTEVLPHAADSVKTTAHRPVKGRLKAPSFIVLGTPCTVSI